MTAEDVTPALLAGLALEAEKLSAESARVSAELHKRGEEFTAAIDAFHEASANARRYRLLLLGLTVFVVVILAGLVAVALVNVETGRAIRSCTTPQGACYQRNQQQGAVLLACADQHPGDIAAIRACIAAATKHSPKGPK